MTSHYTLTLSTYFIHIVCTLTLSLFFFFNDTATTEIYTLSLHDALPISIEREQLVGRRRAPHAQHQPPLHEPLRVVVRDRKSTRLNSSHTVISYAVFCLKKKKKEHNIKFSM